MGTGYFIRPLASQPSLLYEALIRSVCCLFLRVHAEKAEKAIKKHEEFYEEQLGVRLKPGYKTGLKVISIFLSAYTVLQSQSANMESRVHRLFKD